MVLVAVLFAVTEPVGISNLILANESQGSLYVASYSPGLSEDNHIDGNIVLVNPTNNVYSNLSLSIQIDGSEIINPTIRLWYANYSLTSPTSFLQNANFYGDMLNHTAPITTINIEANQNQTIWMNLTSQGTLRFNPHNLTIFISQHNFGDIVNGQSFTMPQTEVYLQIIGYSSVHIDNDTYHEYFSPSRNSYVYRNDNPNFCQRYHNHSWEIGTANYAMAADMGVLGVRYFNVTVHNNSTFHVNSVALFGQIPSMGSYLNRWGALIDYVLQPGETYVFPVGEKELPTYAYATGYITNLTNSER